MHPREWRRYPLVYEINTWVWLSSLGEKSGTAVKLDSVPPAEWDAIAGFGLDAVWLMGVWERSPASSAISNQNPGLLHEFRRALPDFQLRDNVGSAYSVRGYAVDPALGGREGLAAARRELARRGMRLLLDFVPNHVAPDHPWASSNPEYFIRGNAQDAEREPTSFAEVNGQVFACGRDPYFPAWEDVLQLNAFHPGLRQAALETIADIASQSDGIRCDMAMLLLNSIFESTWGSRAGRRPLTEYWTDIIPAIKKTHPDFLFIAEAYWDKEWDLQQLGFDFCYDKRLYDRLAHDSAESVRLHLCADPGYQAKLIRFIENHDEPRAADAFSPSRHQAAAVTMATLPGARMFHEGQFEGRRARIPVFLSRRQDEPADRTLMEFYRKLLATIGAPVFHDGHWRLCERSGWPDNASFQNVVPWSWTREDDRYLIVVNLSNDAAQARVRVPWRGLEGKSWRLRDVLSGVTYERDGQELQSAGMYVGLGPWNYHFLAVSA
ncbi:MAG TPA: alpha-amylase family glycosyl hydrolase [Bryobacteraceae bacterium]|nr:alpha-amylase family glycosyl hydrolase [Bryobacteraceae bacterium]